jgi:hypothetical protein
LGALPLAFAAHQLVEGFVWRHLESGGAHVDGGVAVYLYVVFAWVVLPFLVPLAIALVEPDPARRRLMAGFAALGALVGAYLLYAIVAEDVTAHIASHTIQYGGAGPFAVLATVLYVVATCAPPILSSHPAIRIFGVVDLFAVGVIAYAQADGLTSIWCAWAAVVSVLIYLQFAAWRRVRPPVDAVAV